MRQNRTNNVNFAGIRTLIDSEDRKPSEVVTYTLSPEEIQKNYGDIKPQGKKPFTIANGERNRKHGRYASNGSKKD